MAAGTPRTRGRLQARDGSRLQLFLAGEITVADLTEEELVKGRLMAHDGTMRGRPPELIPREFHQAITSEIIRRGRALFQEHFLEAVKALAEIAKDKKVDEGDRLRAIEMLITRVMGKVPDKVEVHDRKSPFDQMLEDAAKDGFDFGHYATPAPPTQPEGSNGRKRPGRRTARA